LSSYGAAVTPIQININNQQNIPSLGGSSYNFLKSLISLFLAAVDIVKFNYIF
jgi:hypothetical protein